MKQVMVLEICYRRMFTPREKRVRVNIVEESNMIAQHRAFVSESRIRAESVKLSHTVINPRLCKVKDANWTVDASVCFNNSTRASDAPVWAQLPYIHFYLQKFTIIIKNKCLQSRWFQILFTIKLTMLRLRAKVQRLPAKNKKAYFRHRMNTY